jgi:hypothetical protein
MPPLISDAPRGPWTEPSGSYKPANTHEAGNSGMPAMSLIVLPTT